MVQQAIALQQTNQDDISEVPSDGGDVPLAEEEPMAFIPRQDVLSQTISQRAAQESTSSNNTLQEYADAKDTEVQAMDAVVQEETAAVDALAQKVAASEAAAAALLAEASEAPDDEEDAILSPRESLATVPQEDVIRQTVVEKQDESMRQQALQASAKEHATDDDELPDLTKMEQLQQTMDASNMDHPTAPPPILEDEDEQVPSIATIPQQDNAIEESMRAACIPEESETKEEEKTKRMEESVRIAQAQAATAQELHCWTERRVSFLLPLSSSNNATTNPCSATAVVKSQPLGLNVGASGFDLGALLVLDITPLLQCLPLILPDWSNQSITIGSRNSIECQSATHSRAATM